MPEALRQVHMEIEGSMDYCLPYRKCCQHPRERQITSSGAERGVFREEVALETDLKP